MKKRNAVGLLLCGMLLGVGLTIGIGAADNGAAPRKDWSRLRVVTYANDATGFFDPDTGRFYLYDAMLVNCYTIRELGTLGEPLRRIRN